MTRLCAVPARCTAEHAMCNADASNDTVQSQFVQNGVQCLLETGKLAPLSDGSSLLKIGNNWVLATVSCSEGFRMHERTKPHVTVSVRHGKI